MKLSIHTVLLAMIAALMAPAAVFLGLILYDRQVERSAQVLRTGDQLVSEVTSRLENEFRSARTMLALFASSGWLEAGEYAELHQRARSALRGTNRHLIVVDETGQQLVNTRVPYGTKLGKSADTETIPKVLDTGIDAVSNLFSGSISNVLVYNVLRRATLPDGRQRVLILTRDVADLSPILSQNVTHAGWSIGVFDGAGKPAYIALEDDASASELANCEPQSVTTDLDWAANHRVVRRLVRPSDWHTCAWADNERVALAGGPGQLTFLVLWTLGAVGAAVALGVMLSRSIRSAAKVAEALDSGAEVPIVTSPIREISEVLQVLVASVQARQEKDAELMMMAREASHRAKNQIAIASSILRLAARRATSTDQLVSDMTQRLAALGRSVDMMIGGSIDSAPLARLAELQLHPFVSNQPDLLEVSGEDFMISQSAAQSFGLILHEFATNASKYGAWSQPGGRVSVRWTIENDDTLIFTWTEEAGEQAQAPETSGFGTSLIDFIVERSFNGSITRDFLASGFRATIVVPTNSVASIHSADADEIES